MSNNPIALRSKYSKFSHNLLRCTIIVGTGIALCFAPVPSTFAVTLPFTDDFSDGSATDDTPVSWTPVGNPSFVHKVADGAYTMTGAGEVGYALVAGTENLTDVTVRTRFRLTETLPGDGFQYIGAAIRSDSSANNYYFGGMSESGVLSIGQRGGFLSEEVELPFAPTETDVDLEFAVAGQTLSLWAWSDAAGISRPDAPQITWESPSPLSLDSGAIGMGYNPNLGAGTFTIHSFSAVPEPSGGTLAMFALLGSLGYLRTKDATKRTQA